MKYFNFIVAFVFSLIYTTGKIPPSERFNLWVMSFIIPVALAANLVLLLISVSLRKKSSLYYILALLIGSPYLISTFGVNYFSKHKETSSPSFSVLNHNIGGFNGPNKNSFSDREKRAFLRDWILDSLTDVRCFQEFANYPWNEELSIIKQLDQQGTNYYFSQEEDTDHADYSKAGTLIVSRFPIIASGDIMASDNGFNRLSYADVKINDNVIRIINVHLESMGLRNYDPRKANDIGGLKARARTIFHKLKMGVFERSVQIKQLSDFIADSPYPVICVGDFNELPYSYSYQFMKRRLKNAFEESGKGLGFTYNGGTLKVLRIDNQFYSAPVESVKFQTLYNVDFSDHFPIRVEYQVR